MGKNQLLNGEQPTLVEYANFCGVCEKLQKEHLWKMIVEYPSMDITLLCVARDCLRQKIHEENTTRFNQGGDLDRLLKDYQLLLS